MKTQQDKKTLDHNRRQLALMEQMMHNEQWLLSEQLGEDCTITRKGRKALRDRIDDIVLNGFGAWMRSEIKK